MSAATGSFSGEITATSGKIAGWTINSTSISNTNSSGNTVTLNNGSGSSQDVLVVKTGDTYPFYVRADGTFYASKGTFSGALSGATGTFAGSLTTTGYMYVKGGGLDVAGPIVGNEWLKTYGNIECNGGITDHNYLTVEGATTCWTLSASGDISSATTVTGSSLRTTNPGNA